MKDPILMIPDEVQKNNVLLVGNTGGGKSNTAKTLAEYNLWKGRRTCIIDVTGDWWGLKSSADGKSAGYSVTVFGGDHADIGIDESMGAKLGELLATTNTPAVIDLQLFSPERMAKFLAPFFQTLYMKNREVFHLVADEAHRYCPQHPSPHQAKVIHQITDIVTGGRSRGFKSIIITQRPAKLNKDPVAMCKTFIMHEITSSHDRKAIKDWVADSEGMDSDRWKEINGSLPTMPIGEAWVWIPKMKVLERRKFPLAQTFDSGAAPDEGKAKLEPTKLAHVDLEAIRALLTPKKIVHAVTTSTAWAEGTVLNAIEKAVATERRIKTQELEKQAKQHAAQIAAMLKRFKDETRRLSNIVAAVLTGNKAAYESAVRLDEFMKTFSMESIAVPPPVIYAHQQLSNDREADAKLFAEARDRQVPRVLKITERIPLDDGRIITNTERKYLNALAFWRELGHEAPSRAQVAAVAGYPVTSGSTKNSLGALRSQGLIDYPGEGIVTLTGAGQEEAELPQIELTTAGIRQAIDGVLDKAQSEFLDVLIAAYPHEMTREEAAAATPSQYPVTSGSTKNSLGALRTLDLVTYPGQGIVKAADWLFP